ncbi:viral A-type inclusion protein [candidate division SR1 bacterium RAAC1_SR1_1]|nr:viral A-type inclusion protein [candidate division SR1 bacterium RAAC1_SR1_1]
MLDIIAISYKNIGPFKGDPISLFFLQGKYLIKAPIGTGKSFLFFDGPIYGLYKYNTRNLLNNTSSEGQIKILFTFENETRLIIRHITKAKIKESCTSTLYKVQNYEIIPEEIIKKNEDIEVYIKKSGAILEKIEFKNETDLQQTFLSFLPPKEVFVNTVFLMQDSDNIFELLPSERLTVLKNVFGLLGIDEAKEIIAEKKKEISYKLKNYSDTSKYDEKTQFLIKKLFQNHQQLQKEPIEEIKELIDKKNKSLQELELIQEKVTIQDLDISNFGADINLEIDIIIQKEKDKHKKIHNQLENIQESIKTVKQKLDTKRQNLFSIQKNSQEAEENIKSIENNNFEIIKKQVEEDQELLHQKDSNLPYQHISLFLDNCRLNTELEDFSKLKEIQGIESVYSIIKQLIEKGKSLQEKIKNNQLLIQNKQLEQKSEQERYIQGEKTLLDQQGELEKQLLETENHLKTFENNIEQQATFSCEKIQTNCPFIKIINKKTFDQLEEQKKTFVNKKNDLEKAIGNKKEQRENIKKQQAEIGTKEVELLVQQYQENILLQEKATTTIKEFLNNIERKNIETDYQSYITIKKEKIAKELQLKEAENLQKKKEEYIQHIEKNKEIEKRIKQEIQESENEIQSFENNKKTIEEQIQNINYEKILQAEEYNNQCITIQRDIANMINEFKTLQRETELLKKQEKQIGNLYNIFSKELLLLVLQDHLPILNDIINNYLSQIVEYQISLKLNKTNSDKLELEANIIDKEGEREIKSLSGGQKIILKLIWMLSISSYMRSPILFLDETINNLDTETVSKVADMLEDFVKQRNIKFYTVTHNQQIQDMQIRDKVLEITR